MKNINIIKCIKFFCFLLIFGLCITVLSKNVDVYAAANEVKLNVKSTSIYKNGQFRLRVYNKADNQTVVFRSEDSDIATVSSKGVITGVSVGSTVVTATIMEGSKPVEVLPCDVLIGPAAYSIKLTRMELTLKVGSMKLLGTVIHPLNTVESPVFYSSDATVATVSSVGRVRAKKVGQLKVYAFINNGKFAVCNVNVLSEEDYKLYLEGVPVEELITDSDSN